MMTTFKALNIESDDELDDEPDDTKEIQIEEALKIYQIALKNHSQGSKTLKEAGEAYAALFDSEIFKLPESQSEFRREEALEKVQAIEGVVLGEIEFVTATPTSNAENASNALPQILHLSYKNRGQYQLDQLESELQGEHINTDHDGVKAESIEVRIAASKALDDFADALDKDEEDVDLWRRAAKMGQTLKSERISRFCLEGVLDEDEESWEDTLGIPAIEKAVTQQDLKKLATRIDDTLSLSQIPDPIDVPAAWKYQLQLYPFLDAAEPAVLEPVNDNITISQTSKVIIPVSDSTWNGVGQMILQRLRSEQAGVVVSEPGTAVELQLPNSSDRKQSSTNSIIGDLTEPPSRTVQSNGKGSPQSESSNQNISGQVIATPNTTNGEVTTSKINAVEKGAPKSLPERSLVQDEVASNQEIEQNAAAARKRSLEAADLLDSTENGRGRSKRIRARASILDEIQPAEGKALEAMSDYEWKINQSMFADGGLFDILRDITQRLGITGVNDAKELRNVISQRNAANIVQEGETPPQLSQAILDFYGLMQKWTDAATAILLRSNDADHAHDNNPKTDLLAFLEHTKARNTININSDVDLDLPDWIHQANEVGSNINEVAMKYIFTLLENSYSLTSDDQGKVWPDLLKQTLIQLSIDMHDYMIERLSQDRHFGNPPSGEITRLASSTTDMQVVEIVQSLFELHLDVYTRITNPASVVDDSTRSLQKVRLDTWCNVARELVNDYISQQDKVNEANARNLELRHLWASIFHLAVSDDADREHLILCLSELKREMVLYGNPVIYLPNNAVFPELSSEAADREISKLKTKDFFSSVSQKEGKEPVDLIEDLEPLLEESVTSCIQDDYTASQSNERQNGDENSLSHDVSATENVLSQYLRKANVSLRLLLWRRLGDAYQAIGYPPKVTSVYLRSLQLIVNELKASAYAQKKKEEREIHVLDAIRDCGDFVVKILALTEENSNAFECMDDEHIRTSIKALIDWLNLLYSVALFDDYSQIGQKGGSLMNPFRFYPLENFHRASIKLHDMQIQCSILLYKLLSEAMTQIPENFSNATDDKLQYLRNVHWFFGVRRLCKASDSQLLRFTKDELLKLPQLNRQSSDDLAQVLYDLYDLHCFSTPLERLDHGCDSDYLDKTTALQLIDFVMEKVMSTNIKDLMKSELGKTIDKIHGALGAVKNMTFLGMRNRKLYNSYLRSPIRPLELIKCISGLGELSALRGSNDDTTVAASGWYFLKGQLSLTRFRSQRSKSVQASEGDIVAAIGFFYQDLEYNPEHWESWFRMAQAYDAQLEEHVLWSADKINNHQRELCQTQRAAIHAYALATAYMLKDTLVSSTQATIVAELYADFGTRIYASSCQPFAMRVFSTKEFPEKHYSDENAAGGKYTMRPFKSLRSLGAMKLARALLQKAIHYNSHNWANHYMLAKCEWKIHQKLVGDGTSERVATIQRALLAAIKTLPPRKDSNRQDPVLEPIYKVVSMAYKMVLRDDIDYQTGAEMIETCLQMQKQFDVPKISKLTDYDSWDLYVLEILKILRAADKSRWHHRVVFRAARILRDLGTDVAVDAQHAKEYLIEQHLYSAKTLALTVWKPENERPGRHFWYMKQYALFMAQIFEQTTDLESIQTLARRIRKKPNEFYDHTALWEETCLLHLKVHRRYGNIPEGLCDTVFKNVDQEEFGARAQLIDAWTSSPKTKHPLQDVLRETAELKKLNASLMSLASIDDLLGDTYAAIWSEIGPILEQPIPTTPVPVPTVPVTSPPPVADRRSVMSLTNLMNIDGTSDSRPASAPVPPPTVAAVPTPPSLLPAFEMPTKPRARLISRREILKRALDTIISKVPAPQKTTTPPPKPLPRPTDPNVRVVINARPSAGTSALDVVRSGPFLQDPENESGVVSAAGSVHDDADDESELSEFPMDEEEEEPAAAVVRPSIFPNLRVASERAREGGEDAEEEGEEEEEDEMLEGGEEGEEASLGRGGGDVDEGGMGKGEEDSDVVME